MMTEAPAIELVKLSKMYNNKVLALDQVDLVINHGEIIGYLGPNGAGKTTTMKILANLIKPTGGQAFINGVNVQEKPKEALRRAGILLEVPGIYEYLTPVELLTYSGKIYGMEDSAIKKRIDEVLAMVMLGEWSAKKIGSFSTGMIRRLMIAGTMLHDPDIFILDEPVIGLDPRGIYDVRQIIKNLQAIGKTIFLSSHLLHEVSEVCQKIVIINKGKISLVDSVSSILGATTATKGEIRVEFETKLTAEQIEILKYIPNFVKIEIFPDFMSATLHISGGRPAFSKFLMEMMSKGISIVSFAPKQAELEDVYMSLVGSAEGVR